uniref:Envelope glycoprotein n=1 Tax=Haemonchus placei TaxID=6290 RepID=A0A0N4W8T8_HAEPC
LFTTGYPTPSSPRPARALAVGRRIMEAVIALTLRVTTICLIFHIWSIVNGDLI